MWSGKSRPGIHSWMRYARDASRLVPLRPGPGLPVCRRCAGLSGPVACPHAAPGSGSLGGRSGRHRGRARLVRGAGGAAGTCPRHAPPPGDRGLPRSPGGPRARALPGRDHCPVDYREDLPRSLERRRSRESEYRQFVEHWTPPEFADYVTSLEKAVDDALRNSDEQEQERAESAFLEVAQLERDFWEMAWLKGAR
jgi:hypothetical protein